MAISPTSDEVLTYNFDQAELAILIALLANVKPNLQVNSLRCSTYKQMSRKLVQRALITQTAKGKLWMDIVCQGY